MFDRCRRSSAAVTPVKYKSDSKNLTDMKYLRNEEIKEDLATSPLCYHVKGLSCS